MNPDMFKNFSDRGCTLPVTPMPRLLTAVTYLMYHLTEDDEIWCEGRCHQMMNISNCDLCSADDLCRSRGHLKVKYFIPSYLCCLFAGCHETLAIGDFRSGDSKRLIVFEEGHKRSNCDL